MASITILSPVQSDRPFRGKRACTGAMLSPCGASAGAMARATYGRTEEIERWSRAPLSALSPTRAETHSTNIRLLHEGNAVQHKDKVKEPTMYGHMRLRVFI